MPFAPLSFRVVRKAGLIPACFQAASRTNNLPAQTYTFLPNLFPNPFSFFNAHETAIDTFCIDL
jgi:hypothetical protein